MDLEEFMSKHDKVVLQFSAGKDSAVCLKLLRPYIDKVIVVWGNPGDPYKETVEYMRGVRDSVPHFIVAKGDQKTFVRIHGYPADVVPFVGTPLGRAASGQSFKIVPLAECCSSNLWMPLAKATLSSGAMGVIRGERKSEEFKSSVGSAQMVMGQEFFNPIYDWSDEEVLSFLGDDIPPSYLRGLEHSLDCRTCTAFVHHSKGRVSDLARTDPDAYDEVVPVLNWLQDSARQYLLGLSQV
jgi:3'-phosphoadenosine 5'-phosphosulfate sulfotransferase (PAPS reductase)/FAD synthetase